MVRIAVIGCGLMGIKIAGEFAYHGHKLKLYDNNEKSLNSAYARIEEDKVHLREEDLLTTTNFVGQILCFSRLEETVRDAEFIFEAVVDDLNIKQDLFEKISHCCSPSAVIASNTINLDINNVTSRAAYKERTLGLRFLFPVYYIPEVEITPTTSTSGVVIEKVRCLLERMGKTLFFRSGREPLVLSEAEREQRKQARLEQLRSSSGIGYMLENALPALSHRGSRLSSTDTNQYSYNAENDRECAVCMDRERDCILCPCHHMITCVQCAKSLQNRRDCCPVCRKPIAEIIRVYHT